MQDHRQLAGDCHSGLLVSDPLGQATTTPRSMAYPRKAMAELLRWEQFVLARFDARSLAVVREAVEGPPLVADAFARVRPAPAACPRRLLPRPGGA